MFPISIDNDRAREWTPMRKKPRRRLIDRFSASPSILDAGMTLIGDLNCEQDVFVGGAVTGNGKVGGALLLLESGRWKGDVQAANAVIAGRIEGNLQVFGNLEIRKSAHICGSVRAGTIALALGATLEGEVAAGSATSVLHFEEKRKEP